MKVSREPKLLAWLARRAGMPDHVVDTLWNKALALAGVGNDLAAEPRQQAEAMRYLLIMLGAGGSVPAYAAGKLRPALAVACQ